MLPEFPEEFAEGVVYTGFNSSFKTLCRELDTTHDLVRVSDLEMYSESNQAARIFLNAGGFKNSILNALGADIIRRLGLQPVQFKVMQEIEYPGKTIDRLYFVEEGMASMTTTFNDGAQVEVGMFGYESVIGVSALMGTKKSLNRVYTQIAGHGCSCRVEAAKSEFALGGEFQKLALRYVQAQLVQAMQSAGCNARHSFEQRLARWLLICADRAHTNAFKMSHDFLRDMLGGGRPTVTTTAGALKKKGLIKYSRGYIQILDVPKLTKTACECYDVIKDHLDNFTEFDTGITA